MKGNISKSKRVVSPSYCTFTQCPLSLYEVSRKSCKLFESCILNKSAADRGTDHYLIPIMSFYELDENAPPYVQKSTGFYVTKVC